MKLALGTVQFGVNYGITNTHGVIKDKEIKNIIQIAKDNNVYMLDTAPSYGESELKIGNTIRHGDFKIVTKTPHFQSPEITENEVKQLHETFLRSLENLKSDNVYGLIVHSTKDMFKRNSELIFKEMLSLKKHGLVDKIGFSVYEGYEIDDLLYNYDFDLIQVPVNVFDQRLIEKDYLKKLKGKKIEIHARSVFLQGLLLMEPGHVSAYFRPILPLLTKYKSALKEENLTLLEGALAFVESINQIDKIIVGINNVTQFKQILAVYNKKMTSGINYSEFSCGNTKIIDPRKWSEL